MRFRKLFSMGGVWVAFFVLCLFFQVRDLRAQCTPSGDPLVIGGSASMGCGGTQNLSAAGGCPPYNWSLSGGGTLEDTTYNAPTSNANCANNAVIVLTDCCGNRAEMQIAVNCYIGDVDAIEETDMQKCYCRRILNPYCAGQEYQSAYLLRHRRWDCSGNLFYEYGWWPSPGECGDPPSICTNLCACEEADEPVCWNYDNCWSTLSAWWLGADIPCDTPLDVRFGPQAYLKSQGCCPPNPITGSPVDGKPDLESRAKDGGEDPNSCQSDKLVANPVNVATGNKYEKALDLTVSTPGISLEFRRAYNGQLLFDGPLGYGWTHNFNLWVQVVQETSPRRVIVWDSDGRGLYFHQVSQTSGEIIFIGESGVKDRLKRVISTGEYFLRRKQNNLTYRFGSDRKLSEISDPNGNTLSLTYTGGLLTQVSNNFGKAITIQYSGNRISSVTDPKSQSVSYGYTNGDLTSVTYPDSNSISYAYSSHLMTDKYDTDSNLIGHWAYDTSSRVTTYYSHINDTVPQGRIDLTYQAGGTVVTRSSGNTTYTTDIIDVINVVKEKEGCSSCGIQHKLLDYNSRLDVTSVTNVTDSGQVITQYVYDNPENPEDYLGEVQQKTEAVGLTEQRVTTYSYTHDSNDPMLVRQRVETKASVVASNQNRTSTSNYDASGNLTSQVETGDVMVGETPTQRTYTTSYQYNSYGQLTQVNGPRTDVSDITTYEYYDNTSQEGNNRGQLKAIVNALSQRTEFSNYDANGNVGTIADPNGVVTQRTYDERNRISTIRVNYNQSNEALTQYFYDLRGNLTTVILPEGNQIDSTYDLANRLTEVTDSLGNLIRYEYDVEGNRTREETKDPQGTLKKSLDFTYDAYNRLKRIVNPDTGSTYTEYTYDALGNRTNVKDPKDYNAGYTYDNLNRMASMTQPGSVITQYGYDIHDNLTSVTDPRSNVTSYSYDDFGRRIKVISPDTGTAVYSHDEAGNINQRSDARGTEVSYTYDALNRITATQFTDSTQDIAYTYDSTQVSNGIGRLTARTDPSGSYTFYYDVRGNLTKEEKTISSVLYTTEYAYNKDNNLTSITYPSGRVLSYTLDVTGRITQVDTTLNGNPKTLASSISYLPYGGITALTYGNTLSLTHEYDNQYRTSSILAGSVLDRTYTYDANGNITSIDDGEAAGNEALESAGIYAYDQGTNLLADIQAGSPIVYDYDENGNIVSANNRTFTYDLSNRLITVQEGSTTLGQYVYNALNQRIKKILPSETRIFHYDLLGHLIAETNSSGQTLAEYFYLGDQPLAMIRPSEALYYYHNDHLGTPQILTNSSGAVSWKAAYTPFAEAEISIQTVENPFRLPGQYYDQETGLHYNWHRYYDSKTGRYLTPDPIGLKGGGNVFMYAADNPINRIDPRGLKTIYTDCDNWECGASMLFPYITVCVRACVCYEEECGTKTNFRACAQYAFFFPISPWTTPPEILFIR
jgi:RHS repeat-associated protein